MMRLHGLQQRPALYLLFPVASLLAGMGVAGFIYAKNSLLTQWGEAANLKLQRAAHQVDMRLGRAKEWLKMFHNADTTGDLRAHYIHELALEQLRKLEGVARVDLTWTDSRRSFQMAKRGRLPFRRSDHLKITMPRYDAIVKNNTISFVSHLKSESGRTVGKLEVALRFEYLIDTILATGWWQSDQAYLVDDSGKILSSAKSEGRRQLGDNNKSLEVKTLTAMKEKPYGTVISSNFFPSEVSGFYRLKEAPWTLIMIAPGKQILSSVIQFRLYYFITGTAFIFVILFSIKLVMGRTVLYIKALSDAANRVAGGNFVTLASSKSKDEVGELIQNFNTMVVQLEERSKMKETMDLAMDVQQNLLPQKPLCMENLDIAGKSIYCEETGGDYFDFFQFPELGEGRVGIAVGDVVGHGVPAALLMTTVRAFLRSKMAQPGKLAPKINDVNRLLYLDTNHSCDYMSMFLIVVDTINKDLHWVRAGHDPALLYDPATNAFTELNGNGTVLGVDATYSFEENQLSSWSEDQIIAIGTDGIWETENSHSETFGKFRLRQIIRQHSQFPAQEILNAILDSLEKFRGTAPQNDDVTLVVVKAQT